MAGIGDSWGTREELLHPRDKNGRFRSKWKMAEGVVSKILAALAAFNPRTFQSDGQASQYLHNKAKPSRFGGGQGYARLSADFDAANDALRAGSMDASTQKFVKMMDDSAIDLPDDIIVSRRVGPEAFGLTPETMGLDQGGMEDFTGKLIADRGYTSSNIGTPVGTAPIQVSIAVPKGTKAIIPGRSPNDRQIYLDRDQEIRVTKVDPDGRGGYYVLAVAQPRTPGQTPEPVGGPGAPSTDLAGREGQVEQGRQLGLKGMKVPEGEAPLHGTPRQRTEQGLAPNPADLQGPVDTGPGGPPPRNEPVVVEALGQGGAPQAPAVPTGAPTAPGGAPETPIREADFKEAARGVPIPSAGKRRREWNQAYMGIRAGKRDPDDILRELDKDIEVNKRNLADQKSRGDTSDPQLEDDIAAQEKLAELIGRHHDIDGKTSEEAAPTPEPVKAVKKAAPSAPAKKAAPAKRATPAKAVPAKAAPAERRMTLAEAKRQTALDAVRENPIDDSTADTTYKRITKGLEDGTMTVPKARREALGSARYFHESATTVGRNGLTTPEKRGQAHASETAKATKYERLAEALQVSQDVTKTDKYRNPRGAAPAAVAKKAVPEAPPAKKVAAPKKSIEGASPGTAAGKITSLRLTPGTTVLIHKDSSGAWRPTARKTGATKLTVTGNDALSGRGGRRQISGTGPDGEEIKIDVAPVQTFIVDQPKVTSRQERTEAELADIRDRLEGPELSRQERLDIESRLGRLNRTQSRVERPATDDEILGMTKPELIAEAKRQGVDIRPSWTKPKIKEAIELREARSRAIFPQGFEGLEQMRQDVAAEKAGPDGLNLTVRELQSIADSEGVPRRGRPKNKAALQDAIRARREEVANLTSEDQAIIDALGDGPTPAPSVTPTPTPDTPSGIMQRLSSFDNPPTREEAHEMVRPLLKRDLVAMAKDLSVPGAQGLTKEKLRDEIVEATVGRRRDSIATRGFRGLRPDSPEIPEPLSADPAVRAIQMDNRVRSAYRGLSRPGEWVGLADLRESPELRDMTRAEQDEAIHGVIKFGDHYDPTGTKSIRIVPVANSKALKPRDRTAAIRLGDADQHAILFGDPSPRAVPTVVANPVAQKVIQAPDRAADFRLAWHRGGAFKATGAAGRSIDEIRDDIGSGKITPDEGIRRMETEIELNKTDLAEMDADLRGDMGDEQKHMLKQKRDALAKGVATQEKASTFLRKHFKKEPVATPDEVSVQLDEAGRRALDDATPEGLRQAALAQGIKVKGETKEEILKDLVRQMAGKELERRAAEAKKVAPAPKAPDKPKPNLETSPYQRIDTQALAEGLDLRTEWDQKMLARVQEQLDGTDTSLGKNPTPAQIGRSLEKWAHGPAGPFYRGTTIDVSGGRTTAQSVRTPEQDAEIAGFDAQGREWLKLADRLKNTRRRRKEDRAPDVTPTVTRDEKKVIADVAEVTGIPAPELEAKALAKRKAEAAPKQSAVQVSETLGTVGSRDEAKTLLQGRTKLELTEIAKASGVAYGSKDAKPVLIDRIVQFKVGRRLDSDAIGNAKSLSQLREEGKVGGQSPAQVAETLKTVGSRDEAKTLLQGQTKLELQEIAKATDTPIGSGLTKPKIIDAITETTVGGRLTFEVLTRGGMRGDTGGKPTRADLEDMSLAELVSLEDELGIQRVSLNRGDRVDAILAKQAGPSVPTPVPAPPGPSPADVAAELLDARTGPELRRVATALGVHLPAGTTTKPAIKAEIIKQIDVSLKNQAVDVDRKTNHLELITEALRDIERPTGPGDVPGAVARAQEAMSGDGSSNMVTGKIVRALNDDPGLTLSKLREVADQLGVDVPPTIKTKAKLQLHIAESLQAKSAPEVPAPAKVTPAVPKASGPRLKSAINLSASDTKLRNRPGNDEPVHLPNGGADQGNMHFDSAMGELWQELYADDREPNSFVNEIAQMGDRMGMRGDADLERDVIPMLERLRERASDSVIQKRIQETIDDLSAPPMAVPDLPEGTPVPIRAAMETLSKIPTARKRGRIGAAFVREPILQKKAKLIRDFVAGEVGFREFENQLHERDLHESADGAYRMWVPFERLFNREPIVGYRQGPGGKLEPITEVNPDYDIVRDWIRATRRK